MSPKSKTDKKKTNLHLEKDKILKNSVKQKRIIKELIFFTYLFLMAIFIGYHFYYAEKIIPGVKVNQHDIGGMTVTQAIKYLNEEVDKQNTLKVLIPSGGEIVEYEVSATDIGFRYLLIDTVKEAYNIGRKDNFVKNLSNKIYALRGKVVIEPSYDYNENATMNQISLIKNNKLKSLKETSYGFDNGNLTILQGQRGEVFDEQKFTQDIIDSFVKENFGEINLNVTEVDPMYSIENLDQLKPQMDYILQNEIKLVHDDYEKILAPEEKIKIFIPIKSSTGMKFEISEKELGSVIYDLGLTFDRNPSGQILEIENGKAIKFVASQNGLKLKVKETTKSSKDQLQKFLDELGNKDINQPSEEALGVEIEMAVQVTEPPQNGNEFNIEDLIGVGKSKFRGSIPSRIHNIGLASSKVSGTLVPPGEIFSFNQAVGQIDRQNGYQPAYVISGGRTILGDGGGVCQVSTTVFRAALDAGFPILERHPHSYRVGYYEQESQLGVDASIYVPTADLKFKNDTEGYILIVSEFDEDNYSLNFKIYGKDDGREVDISDTRVISKSSAPPAVYIDDPSLPKGKKVQIEYSAGGAQVVFTRTVKKNGETTLEDSFKSNYRPWAAVYRIGTAE